MSEDEKPYEADPVTQGESLSYHSLSLRDYFAARAMSSLLDDGFRRDTEENYARDAYRMADAMLKARKGQQ